MPLISICIPAYNRAAVLPALLDSILEQDFGDINVVITEDASPERQAIKAVIDTYSERFPGKLDYHENQRTLGYDGNLRRLIEVASGDYVLFMGNDDLLAPGALAAVAVAVCERQDVGVVLRSYSSFRNNPGEVVQVFRYFDGDRVFPPGPDTVVTFFRRSVFISGMVFKRQSALACATSQFDGTLLYQQHLVGRILTQESGVYLNKVLSFHRLGGTPDFGASEAEQGKFVPKEQTAESSVHFMRGMLAIACSLDNGSGSKVAGRILKDIGNYAYPILSIQADKSSKVFLGYLRQIALLGFWKVPLFHVYAFGLLLLGRRNCDAIIAKLKHLMGRAPMLGNVYAGQSRGREEK